jgi:hypothetical protein
MSRRICPSDGLEIRDDEDFHVCSHPQCQRNYHLRCRCVLHPTAAMEPGRRNERIVPQARIVSGNIVPGHTERGRAPGNVIAPQRNSPTPPPPPPPSDSLFPLVIAPLLIAVGIVLAILLTLLTVQKIFSSGQILSEQVQLAIPRAVSCPPGFRGSKGRGFESCLAIDLPGGAEPPWVRLTNPRAPGEFPLIDNAIARGCSGEIYNLSVGGQHLIASAVTWISDQRMGQERRSTKDSIHYRLVRCPISLQLPLYRTLSLISTIGLPRSISRTTALGAMLSVALHLPTRQ